MWLMVSCQFFRTESFRQNIVEICHRSTEANAVPATCILFITRRQPGKTCNPGQTTPYATPHSTPRVSVAGALETFSPQHSLRSEEHCRTREHPVLDTVTRRQLQSVGFLAAPLLTGANQLPPVIAAQSPPLGPHFDIGRTADGTQASGSRAWDAPEVAATSPPMVTWRALDHSTWM